MNYLQRLDKAIESVQSSLRVTGLDVAPQWSDDLKPLLVELRSNFAASEVGYCIERFVAAELDWQSPGDRGLGRVSTEVPRYAACVRAELRRLSRREIDALGDAVRTQLLSGYLAFVLTRELSFPPILLHNGELLFKNWIPQIYSAEVASAIDDESKRLIGALGFQAFEDHLEQGRKLGLPLDDSALAEKINMILFFYHVAGFLLRFTERVTVHAPSRAV